MPDNQSMGNNVIISSDDGNSLSSANSEGKRPAMSQAERQRRYQAKKDSGIARMKRIVAKAEALNEALLATDGEQLVLPLALVSSDVEQTLANLQKWVSMTQSQRNNARKGIKREVKNTK
jgi:hypothetical protein